jgi:outer membrane protein OmpA-like peptidoglycan-associated protein
VRAKVHGWSQENLHVVVACVFVLCGLQSVGCSKRPVPGPDKMFSGAATGAVEGAGAGAVMGFQMGVATGPGAAIGAGFGAAAGAIHGMVRDSLEEDSMHNAYRIRQEQRRVVAQEVLAAHYERRMAIYPARDIYPADLFFVGDSASLSNQGVTIVSEIAKLNKHRLPYSRIVVASYAKSIATSDNVYVRHLTERRAREIVNELIKAGVEPRRLETRSVIVDAPVVIDPKDNPTRYNQAIELIPVDK